MKSEDLTGHVRTGLVSRRSVLSGAARIALSTPLFGKRGRCTSGGYA